MNLTPKQVENWRKILSVQLGPYAFIMPVDQIEKLRDKMQKQANKLDKEAKNEEILS